MVIFLRSSFIHLYSIFESTISTVTRFSSSGTPINKRPVLGYRNLNLFKLYRLVHKLGGFDKVSAASAASQRSTIAYVWRDVD